MKKNLLITLLFLIFTANLCKSQTISIANKEPGNLENQIRNELALEKAWIDNSKENVLIVKGVLAKEDVHFIASLVKEKDINKLDLSGSKFREIGFGLFADCSNIKSVRLPKTVKTIAKHAFKNCGLTNINLPTSLTSIGTESFAGCGQLSQVTIQKKLSWIGTDAFKGCPIKTFKIKKNNEYRFDGTHLYSKNNTIIY